MTQSRQTSIILLGALGLGALFWVADAVYEYFFFVQNFRLMMFEEPLSLSDSLYRNIPPHTFFTRVAFLLACLVGGGMSAWYLRRRQEAETALRASEERLRVLFEQAADAVYVCDPDGYLTQVNEQACRATDRSREELLALTAADVDADVSLETARAMLQEIAARGPRAFETTHRRKDGSTYPVEITLAHIHGPGESRFLAIARDITGRRRAQEALRESEERHRLLFETSSQGIGYFDLEGRVIAFNALAARRMGGAPEDFVGRSMAELYGPEAGSEYTRRVREAAETPDEQVYEDWVALPAGERCYLSTFTRVTDATGAVTGVQIVSTDLTDRKRAEEEQTRLEAQLRQSQRMEAVGQLTGGVAHDFNNLLQVINGATEMAMIDLADGHPSRESMAEVARAGQRAAQLVSQLLAFSRRQVMRLEVLDLNDAVEDLLKMLGRVIGEHIRLEWIPGPRLGPVRADRGMIEQALVNLAVNARDAMPEGGALTIETRDERIDEAFCRDHAWAVPGRYALLVVTDTGCGMDAATVERIFEPFFTTKETGKGTGLGLATVYGVVKQHKGMITVYSEPGRGASFRLYWPVTGESRETPVPPAEREIKGGAETILLAEDDEGVRSLAARLLEHAGYTVLIASDGFEAVSRFGERGDGVDLAILDVVMPGMGGREACERLRAIRPDIKVLFTSGYSENAVHTDFVLDEGLTLLQKPYARESLLKAVRAALGG